MGAVLIDGPKAVGKTRTAEQIARTVHRMDVDNATRSLCRWRPISCSTIQRLSCSTSGRKLRSCGIACVAGSTIKMVRGFMY